MLKRKITTELLKWKKEKKKPCLLVKGARQVGKTFIIDDFAKRNYKNYIYINFELQPSLKTIFDGDLDIQTLKLNLEVNFPDVKLVPHNTILFLDEIQSCPNARTALKTFALDGTIDVVASGSLLGLHQKEVSSLPVGYVKTIELLPLDFEEFLWGIGISKDTIKTLRHSFEDKTRLSAGMINKMEDYFRTYMIVGGMPEVVQIFFDTHSLQAVREKQLDLLADYNDDVVKYAPTTDKLKIRKALQSIPMQLAKKNKKFMFSDIDKDDSYAGSRKYASAVLWLENAGIINFCYNLTEPAAPLASNRIPNIFKIYMKDTGLLMGLLDAGVQKSIWEKDYTVNAGSILENAFAQEIYSRYRTLTFFERKGTLEIDFIANIDGDISAIEVKSGKHTQSKSLNSIKQNYKTASRRIRFELGVEPMVDEKGTELYPLFMSMFI